MRTHFLSELPLLGKTNALATFPDFDFYKLGKVTSLAISEDLTRAVVDMRMTAVYVDLASPRSVPITLQFHNVRMVDLPKFSPFFYLSELEIEAVRDRQMDGITYISKCYGQTKFEVYSKDLSVYVP